MKNCINKLLFWHPIRHNQSYEPHSGIYIMLFPGKAQVVPELGIWNKIQQSIILFHDDFGNPVTIISLNRSNASSSLPKIMSFLLNR